jgi:hypothetical protein
VERAAQSLAGACFFPVTGVTFQQVGRYTTRIRPLFAHHSAENNGSIDYRGKETMKSQYRFIVLVSLAIAVTALAGCGVLTTPTNSPSARRVQPTQTRFGQTAIWTPTTMPVVSPPTATSTRIQPTATPEPSPTPMSAGQVKKITSIIGWKGIFGWAEYWHIEFNCPALHDKAFYEGRSLTCLQDNASLERAVRVAGCTFSPSDWWLMWKAIEENWSQVVGVCFRYYKMPESGDMAMAVKDADGEIWYAPVHIETEDWMEVCLPFSDFLLDPWDQQGNGMLDLRFVKEYRLRHVPQNVGCSEFLVGELRTVSQMPPTPTPMPRRSPTPKARQMK